MDILELGNDAAAIDQLLYLVEEPSDMHDVLIWPSTVTKLRHGAFLPIDIRKGQDPLHMFAFGPRTDLPLAVADEYDQITMFLAIAATDGRVLDNNTRHKCQNHTTPQWKMHSTESLCSRTTMHSFAGCLWPSTPSSKGARTDAITQMRSTALCID